MSRAVHLAGNNVIINGRSIQRCLLCGEKLSDSLGEVGPVGPNGEPPQHLIWCIGHWIEQDGNRWLDVGETTEPFITGAEVPDDCCIELVER